MILNAFFFVFILGVRPSIDVLDPGPEPESRSGKIRNGSGALWLIEDVWHQKFEDKNEDFLSYLKY